MVGEMDSTGAMQSIYIRGANGLERKVTPQAEEPCLENVHGDLAFVNRDRYDYEAFGEPISVEYINIPNPIGYCGEYTDAETGLIYLRNRYYDPTIGELHHPRH